MAVEQSGAGASPGKAAPEAGQEAVARTDPKEAAAKADPKEAAVQADLDEVKRKFREALERKRSGHASAEGVDHTGKVHGAHGPAASRRSFRRKSGG